MGMWAACQPVGNIFGNLLTGIVLPYGYEVSKEERCFQFLYRMNNLKLYFFELTCYFHTRSKYFFDKFAVPS